MIKIFKYKKNKKSTKGLTLTELVAGMFIFTVIALSVTAILTPTLKAYSKANDLAETNTLLDNLSADILNDLSRAAGIALPDTEEFTGNQNDIIQIWTNLIMNQSPEIVYSLSDPGFLYRNGQPLFNEKYYRNKTVNFDFVDEGGKITLIVILLNNLGEVIAEREYAVKPLGLTPRGD